MNRDRLAGVELLRFLLAWAVLVHHFCSTGAVHGLIGGADWLWAFPLQFAVQGFFIVSGFVITASIASRTPGQFAVSRITRLGPALLVCSTLTYLTLRYFGGPLESANFGRLMSSVLILPLVPFDGIDPVMWTLRYEIIFYVAVFLLALKLRVQDHAINIAAALVTLDAASIALHSHLGLAPYGSWFALGLLLHAGRQGKWSYGVILGALVMGALQMRDTLANVALTGTHAIFCALVVFLLVAGAIRLPLASSRLVSILGAASFPLYLLHHSFGIAVANQFTAAGLPIYASHWLAASIVIGLSIAIAVFVEPPLSTIYRRALSLRPLPLLRRSG